MPSQYSIEQAQTQLSDIMAEVEQGTLVEILKSGRRVAVLVSSQDYERLTISKPDFWDALTAFRREFNIEAEGIEADVFEGLRDLSPGREVDL